jgi:hypothetical protein
MTLTTSFIKNILDIPYKTLLKEGFKDSYLGAYHKTKDKWGESIYLLFNLNQISPAFRTELIKRPEYISAELLDSDLLLEFHITEDNYRKIVAPFLEGKYSKICRDYTRKNFNEVAIGANGKPDFSNNYKVLVKHPDLRKYWEERIGVEFTEDMEVWSRPEKENEIYGYPKSDTELAPEAGSISSSGC